MKFLLVPALVVSIALAFGVPGVPDVPDVDIPEFEIPGLEMLDEIQVKLDDLLGAADELGTLIPDLMVLEELSAKLDEYQDTDPEIAELQAKIDSFRGELVAARDEIMVISDELESELGTIQTTVDDFTEGLPIP